MGLKKILGNIFLINFLHKRALSFKYKEIYFIKVFKIHIFLDLCNYNISTELTNGHMAFG